MKSYFPGATLCLLLFAGLGLADDFPQWRGPNRDGVLPPSVLPKPFPKELKKLWTVKVGVGHSSPVVVAGKVYMFARNNDKDTEVLRCLELKSGNEVWAESYPAPYKMAGAARGFGKGPRSTPVVADGKVFTLGVSGILTAYDAKSGKGLWQHTFDKVFPATSATYGSSMSPIVYGKTVIAHVGGPKGGELAAFNMTDGKKVWSWDGDGPGYASPIIFKAGGMDRLVTQSQQHIIAVNPKDGKLLWKLPFKTAYNQNIVTPVRFKTRIIISGTGKGTSAIGLDATEQSLPGQTWHNDMSQYMSSPVISGAVLFGFSEKKRGTLFCANVGDGKVYWKSEGGLGQNAAILVSGDRVLVLTNKGQLLVVANDKSALKILSRHKVADSSTFATPAIADGKLLIKDEDSLICYALTGKE